MKLYFVRHGESTANLEHIFSNEGYKHPLTENGVKQALGLAQRLIGVQFALIYSSPICRAIETAKSIAGVLHAPVRVTEALREWSVGEYEGTTDPRGWELHAQVQELWFKQKLYDSRMPGGESFNEIRKRFCPFIMKLLSDEAHSDRNILLVGHGGLYTAMLPTILKNVPAEYAYKQGFPNGKYVLAESRPTGLYCISWCDDQL